MSKRWTCEKCFQARLIFNNRDIERHYDTIRCKKLATWELMKEWGCIPLKEIAWRGKHNFPYFTEELQTERYKNCNTKYPGIISYNAPNPYDNKYRMIDGRHRIIKLLREGVTESLYYTLNFNDIKHLIEYDRSRKYNISLTARTKYL